MREISFESSVICTCLVFFLFSPWFFFVSSASPSVLEELELKISEELVGSSRRVRGFWRRKFNYINTVERSPEQSHLSSFLQITVQFFKLFVYQHRLIKLFHPLEIIFQDINHFSGLHLKQTPNLNSCIRVATPGREHDTWQKQIRFLYLKSQDQLWSDFNILKPERILQNRPWRSNFL